MSEEAIVKVEHVSKKFCRSLKRSLWYGVKDLARELSARNGTHGIQMRPEEFLAVDDVSFELRRGECLGLIGPNGAGKSTLLKMLNGLSRPDAGRITIRGRVGALIELGTGFSPILSGRENIYVNGAVLGFSKKEIDRKFDEIVDFAELAEFIDAPVQSYSSGMRVRLGFAVAACLDPHILLVDEVLAVGDAAFRLKCMRTIRNRVDSGMTIILVSHQLGNIINVCGHAIWLDKGKIRNLGPADETCSAYETSLTTYPVVAGRQLRDGAYFDSHAGAEIVAVHFSPAKDGTTAVFSCEEEICLAVKVSCIEILPSLTLTYGLRTIDDTLAYGSRFELGKLLGGPGSYSVKIRIPPRSLLGGQFYFSCGLSRGKDWGYTIHNIPHSLSLYVASRLSAKYTRGIADLKAKVSVTLLQ
jgi:ABC-type polysaccharide/polyol phosphate transport system ATPase subunit